MAYTNLPPSLQEIFYRIADRVAKLETAPNQAMYVAEAGAADAAVALEEAELALAQADAAFVLAGTAIQGSTNTILNASKQLTAINGNGITVYAGTSATTGSRVVLNSAGIAGFNTLGATTFAINATNGNVSITGASFTSGTISGGSLNINGNFIVNTDGFMTCTGATITGTITGSTITGGTVQTSSGTNGVILNGSANALQFRSNGIISANMLPLGTLGGGGLIMHYGATPDGNGGTFPQIYLGPSNVFIGATAQIGISVQSDFGYTSVSGGLRSRTNFFNEDSSTVVNAANVRMDLDGRTRRSTASSIRYKENVVDLVDVEELHPSKLLDIPIRAFSYKQAHLPDTDDRSQTLIPGFIAEEVDNIYPIAADYESGQAESWNDRILVPAMLALIQDLHKRVVILEQ